MDTKVPMRALKNLYNETTFHGFIEIDAITEHGESYEEIQITGTHGDLGVVTIRQSSIGASMLADCFFDFDEEDPRFDPAKVKLDPHLTTAEKRRALSDAAYDFMLPYYEEIESLGAEAFALAREKAAAAGIPVTKINFSYPDGARPGWWEDQVQVPDDASQSESAFTAKEEEDMSLLMDELSRTNPIELAREAMGKPAEYFHRLELQEIMNSKKEVRGSIPS